MMVEDGRELLRRWAHDRDEEAMTAFVRLHWPAVFAVAGRQLSRSHDAEDVTQAVFAVAARKAERVAAAPSVTAWLLRAAYLAAVEARRRERRRLRREQAAARPDAETMTVEPSIAWKAELDRALNRLASADRDALVLRFIEERTYAEIAAATGTRGRDPEAAARQRVSRALTRLRRHVKPAETVAHPGAVSGVFSGALLGELVRGPASAGPVAESAAAWAAPTGAVQACANGVAWQMAGLAKLKAVGAGGVLVAALLAGGYGAVAALGLFDHGHNVAAAPAVATPLEVVERQIRAVMARDGAAYAANYADASDPTVQMMAALLYALGAEEQLMAVGTRGLGPVPEPLDRLGEIRTLTGPQPQWLEQSLAMVRDAETRIVGDRAELTAPGDRAPRFVLRRIDGRWRLSDASILGWGPVDGPLEHEPGTELEAEWKLRFASYLDSRAAVVRAATQRVADGGLTSWQAVAEAVKPTGR